MRSKTLLMILVLLISVTLNITADTVGEINIVYPKANQKVSVKDETFILGNIVPKNAELEINGAKIDVYKTGGFLAFLPVTQGYFNFNCKLILPNKKVVEKIHTIFIPKRKYPKTTAKPLIEKSNYLPSDNTEALIGEEVVFQCKTIPNQNVICRIDKNKNEIALQETEINGVKGFYSGTKAFYDNIENSSFTFEVDKASKIAPFKPPVTITVLPPYRYPILEIMEDEVKARYKPNGGYDTFLRKGTVVKASGSTGQWQKVNLSEKKSVYVEKRFTSRKKNQVAVIESTITGISCREDEDTLSIKINKLHNANGTWIEHPDEKKLSLEIYNAHANIDRVEYIPPIKSLSVVKWRQKQKDILVLDVYLKYVPLYGYHIDFYSDYALLTINKSPKNKPLKKINICIDAGHGGVEKGAVGPTEKWEAELALAQVKVIGKTLKEKGFNVFYTRENNNKDVISLYERAPYASKNNADFFISVHYNATADGVNPYKCRSTETYF
ncbi:MAG: hypothetical protein ACD_79C01355G0001, partial [uncultured bacterium]